MLPVIFYLALFYIIANLFGALLEKIRIPKIYAALFLGVLLSTNQAVLDIVELKPVHLLTQAGMFALLFLLGFNLDLGQIKKQKKLIVRVTFRMISAEVVVGTLLLHFLFSANWLLAAFVSLSFATVGEVALLPILREFKLIKTQLGQSILGVSILDDVVELVSFVILLFYVSGLSTNSLLEELLPILAIGLGVMVRKLISESEKLEKYISISALVIFGPLFFFYAGTEANLNVFVQKFLIIVLMTLIIKATKLASVYSASARQLGAKKAIVMAVSLSIKFSTSIIILTILLTHGLITEELFSVLIGIKVLFKFIIPIVLSLLLKSWHLHLKDAKVATS